MNGMQAATGARHDADDDHPAIRRPADDRTRRRRARARADAAERADGDLERRTARSESDSGLLQTATGAGRRRRRRSALIALVCCRSFDVCRFAGPAFPSGGACERRRRSAAPGRATNAQYAPRMPAKTTTNVRTIRCHLRSSAPSRPLSRSRTLTACTCSNMSIGQLEPGRQQLLRALRPDAGGAEVAHHLAALVRCRSSRTRRSPAS